MGVSKADLTVYINGISTSLLVIGGAIIVLLAVLIGAHWVKKGYKMIVRGQAIVCFLTLLAVVLNYICYHAPIYGPLSTYLNANAIEINEELSLTNLSITERIGAEGFVLLKNEEETLPLSKKETKINVFGWASTKPYLGGTGSSAGANEEACGIIESLEMAGFETNKTLTALYTDYAEDRPIADMFGQNLTLPEPTVDVYSNVIMEEAKEFSDTAMVVIARGGGENYDLPEDMNEVINGSYNKSAEVSNNPDVYPYTKVTYQNNGDYDDFDSGESYLELSNTEENMLKLVCENFSKVIVVINSCNPMELGWVDSYAVDAVLYAPAAGAQGFAALGNILNGSINPSGKTVDTWVYDLQKTPYRNNIGIFSYTNVDELKDKVLSEDETYQGAIGFVNYVEGIYIGYKFYETAAEEGVLDYEETVQYPFGYGLSYTEFEEEITDFTADEDGVLLEITVKNCGNYAGRDVVELYYTPPYINGGIEKSSVNLIDFMKTESLMPGESQKLQFYIEKEEMASYDSEKKKTENGGYVLEKGTYTFSVRKDSHTVVDTRDMEIKQDIIYEESSRSSDFEVAVNQFEDYTRGEFEQLSRTNRFENYEIAVATPVSFEMSQEMQEELKNQLWGYYDESAYINTDDTSPNFGVDSGMVLSDLTGADYDDPRWDTLLDQLKVEEMVSLVNNGGWKTEEISSIGKVLTNDSDGPAGLNNYITGASGTTFPASILIAQTWNKEVAEMTGEAMGREFSEANNYGWYGPAMNLHRSAFSGRNFEYYSEDSILTGMMASAEANGASHYGVYPYLKHFAMNEQELGRTAVLLTFASEQTIRESYLKPFEYTIKHFEGKALAVMSSYNFIGLKYAGANEELLQKVLRDEWGFKGMVITDYDGSYGYVITDAVIRNGGDLMLGYGSYNTNALNQNQATVQINLRRAVKNILYTVANSGYYVKKQLEESIDSETVTGDTETQEKNEKMTVGEDLQRLSNMDWIFKNINIATVTILSLAEILVILQLVKKKKENSK